MSEPAPNNLTGGRLLARNTIFNFAGEAAPLVVALLAIPLLIGGLGTERFGVLALAWLVLGYFSLFDLGLGRALTVLVAERLGMAREREIAPIVWTALFLMLILGLVGTVFVGLLSPLLVWEVLEISAALRSETLHAFYLVALSIPVIVSTAGLRGILEAYQRFDLTNAVRIPMVVLAYVGPLLVLPFSQSLVPVVAVSVAGRLLDWLIHLLLCFRVVPALRKGISLQRTAVGSLLRFGGWMTVTNVLGPLMVDLDRFLIGALISATAVAYYATPYEMATKLWVVPAALVGVLFPAFASSLVRDRARAALLFGRGVKYVFLALFPIVLLIVTLAYEGLDLWLGAEFAQNSSRVLQLLAVGIFINSLAFIPFALVQGAGRPDLTAKLHLVELPFYLFALWWLLGAFGIEGAAVAWVIRVAVDALLLFAISWRFLPTGSMMVWRTALIMGVALLALALTALLVGLALKGLFLSLTLPAFALAAWFIILAPTERALVRKRLKLAASSREDRA